MGSFSCYARNNITCTVTNRQVRHENTQVNCIIYNFKINYKILFYKNIKIRLK